MSYPLRLKPELELAAREQAEAMGISFNALVSVALYAYLRQPCSSVQPVERPAGGVDQPAAQPVAPAGEPVKLTKQQRRELTERERLARKHLGQGSMGR